MQTRHSMTILMLTAAGLFAGADCFSVATPAVGESEPAGVDSGQIVAVPPEAETPLTVAAAREQSRTMHRIYLSTLDTMHDHYFHANRAVLPARAMEDIFGTVDRQSGVKTRWIAVNANAMSVDHEPIDEFERQAARKIASGEAAVEQTEPDMYRFAGAIPLQDSCIQCHMGTMTVPSRKRRFAGLVISIPLAGKDAPAP